jgi:hypothetical protein
MKLSLSWIAVITCLAIVGLSAGGCSQTTSGAMGTSASLPSTCLSVIALSLWLMGAWGEAKRAALKTRTLT